MLNQKISNDLKEVSLCMKRKAYFNSEILDLWKISESTFYCYKFRNGSLVVLKRSKQLTVADHASWQSETLSISWDLLNTSQ